MAPSNRSGNGPGKGRGRGRGSGGRGNRSESRGTRQGATATVHPSPVTLLRHVMPPERVHPRPQSTANSTEEIEDLMAQADTMMAQLQDVYARISALQRETALEPPIVANVRGHQGTSRGQDSRRMTAVIDPQECLMCGICVDVCPEEAIRVEATTVIDKQKCTGCGACVEACPIQAVTLGVFTQVL